MLPCYLCILVTRSLIMPLSLQRKLECLNTIKGKDKEVHLNAVRIVPCTLWTNQI